MKVPTMFATSSETETLPFARSPPPTKSPSSPKSPQRSVSSMKALLPLQLSPVAPTSRYIESRREKLAEHEAEEERVGTFRRHKRSTRSRSNRDIPIYAPRDSIPDAYYFQSEEQPYSSPLQQTYQGPFIINDYELTDSDVETPPRFAINMRANYRSSWEIPRTQDVRETDVFSHVSQSEELIINEGSWVNSPQNRWNDGRSECLPYVLSQSMPQNMPVEQWLTNHVSWLEDDEDVLKACATSLAPTKANVVEVNKRDLPRLSICIPPRMSSRNAPKVEEPRASWMTFGGHMSSYSEYSLSEMTGDSASEVTSEVTTKSNPPPRPNSKFWMTMPDDPDPLSPASLSAESFLPSIKSPPTVQEQQPYTFTSPRSFTPSTSLNGMHTSPKRDSLHETISDLENHLGAFPSWMLLEDSNCITAIRKYLKVPSQNLSVPRPAFDPPLSPALSQDAFPDVSTAFQSNPFIATAKPAVETAFNQQLLQAQTQSYGADLEPLARIFPDASNFMRSALYAHLLAYIFVTSLTPSFNLNLIPASPAKPGTATASSATTTARHRPVSNPMPSKAAEFFGLSESERCRHDMAVPSATKAIEEQLVNHIATLVEEMERPPGTAVSDKGKARIGRTALMALVEVVRAGEGA